MNIIKNLKSLDEMHDALFSLEKASIQTEIGCSGRKFTSQVLGTFILNDLVKQLLVVTKNVQPSTQINKKVTEIVLEIKKFDEIGNKVLIKKNILLMIATRICQFFGNFGFNRKEVLKKLEHSFLPALEIEAKMDERKNPLDPQNIPLQNPQNPIPQDLTKKIVEAKNEDDPKPVNQDQPIQPPQEDDIDEDTRNKIEEAKNIIDKGEKNNALYLIALNLAQHGNFTIALNVVNEITQLDRLNAVCHEIIDIILNGNINKASDVKNIRICIELANKLFESSSKIEVVFNKISQAIALREINVDDIFNVYLEKQAYIEIIPVMLATENIDKALDTADKIMDIAIKDDALNLICKKLAKQKKIDDATRLANTITSNFVKENAFRVIREAALL